MGSTYSFKKRDLEGPAKIMYEKYGAKAVEFLPKWHKNLGFPQNGSFSHALLRSLRKKMGQKFEELIEKKKASDCVKLKMKWTKQLNCLKMWDTESDSRKRVDVMNTGVKSFVSLCADEAQIKIGNSWPRGLVDEIAGTNHYTTPFCDYVADFDPTFPQNGSFDKAHIVLLRELINQPLSLGPANWDYSYMQECFGVWETISRKVNHTVGILKSRPKPAMVSIHTVDDLLDCPVVGPALLPAVVMPQAQIQAIHTPPSPVFVPMPALVPQAQSHSPPKEVATPKQHALVSAASSKAAVSSPPQYGEIMEEVLHGMSLEQTPSPYRMAFQRGAPGFFNNAITPGRDPSLTRSGLPYQPNVSPLVGQMQDVLRLSDEDHTFSAPMIECPNGQGGVQRVYRPWKVAELQAIVSSLPDPKNNGETFATALKKMVLQCSPTAAELEHVCITKMGLLWADVKPAGWDSSAAWSIDAGSVYQRQLGALATAFETRFKPVINMTMVNSCVQKSGESFDDYFIRKLPVFNSYSGSVPPTDLAVDSPWERQFVQALVDGLLPELKTIFLRHCVGWQSARLEEVKKYCVHADMVVQEERTAQMKKSKATTDRLQMAQLDYYTPNNRGKSGDGSKFNGKGRGKARGRGGKHYYGNRYNDGLCWNCRRPGHQAKDCEFDRNEEAYGNTRDQTRPPSSQVSVSKPFAQN